MDPKIVVLGGVEFRVVEPSIRRGEVWRQQLSGPVDQVVSVISEIDQDLEDVTDLAKLIPNVKEILLGSIGEIVELVITFDQSFEAEREYILDNATATEAINAFMEMVQVAFPLGGLLKRIGSLSSGLQGDPTSKSLQNQNGAVGVKI